MLNLTEKKITLLRGLIGYNFNELVPVNIDKSEIKPFTYMSHNLKMTIQFKINNDVKQIAIESFFVENDDGDTFYDFTIEQTDPMEYKKLPKITFHSSPIKEILVYGRKFEIDDFKDRPEIYQKFIGTNKTDDALIFKCEDDQEVLLYFHYFLPHFKLTQNRNEIEFFWNNFGELYEKHWTIE